MLYIDLDRLKAINDGLGHAAGDWFIQDFADRLLACAGSQSMVARLGGDEFVVVPDQPMSAHAAESFADRIRNDGARSADDRQADDHQDSEHRSGRRHAGTRRRHRSAASCR